MTHAAKREDRTSLATFSDGTTFREITPSGYVEGALMFKRNGIYYLMWSEGGWTGPDYRVSYAMASSPARPSRSIPAPTRSSSSAPRASPMTP